MFSGEESFFKKKKLSFNKTCALMTVQTKITNIHNLSVHEYCGLYLQVENIISNGTN